MFLSFNTMIIKNLLLVGLFLLVLLFSTSALAAEVLVEPNDGTYGLGQTFAVSIEIAPGSNIVNAVEATLKFDPSILSVVEIIKVNSAFTRWTTEPTFSNSLGTINFSGVNTAPFTAPANLVEVTFRALAPGSGGLAVTNASAFATDGLRTDVFTRGIPATFTVSSSALDIASTADEADLNEPTSTIEVYSQTFYDPEVWNAVDNGLFTWELPPDVIATAVEIATSSSNRPNNNAAAISQSAVTEFLVTADMVADGIQYLSLRYSTEEGWGEVLNRKLLIDITPPEPFEIGVFTPNSKGAFPILSFDAVDFTSGVRHYEVLIGDNVSLQVSPEEAKLGFSLSELEDGVYPIRVVAYDSAGNIQESTTEVTVAAGWVGLKANAGTKTVNPYMFGPHLYSLLLTLIILLLLIVIYFERRKMILKEVRLRRETHEIQEQMEKIFSALRDEIYEQINTITKRKRLSKAEKEAVDGLHQAIEVSETLIEKEISDVKKILK